MKVLHLISGGDSGGAKTHLFSLLDKLKLMADVRVGCLMEGVFYREILHKDIDTVLFKQKNRFDLSVVNEIADMINREGFDVFHVHGARANFVACFVLKKINIPTITTVHSDYLLDFDDPIKKLVFTNLNKNALGKIPYYIAVSDNFKDMLIGRGFRPNSIYTVYNGMDFSLVPENATEKSEYAQGRGFTYDENKVYVGIAARFDLVKGVDVFIKAAGKVLEKRCDVEFLIAGDGVEKENLERLANETKHPEKIKFLGFERDIYGFLNLIDINCLTSLCESFPYSMLEGAAMGKPMVASRVGGIPSLVVEGETGKLFESGDYTQMAQKLIEMIEDSEERISMGENIKTRATTLFTNDNFAKTHMKIYEDIVEDFKRKKRYDFVISGYYGFHNNGDDALLKAICEDLKKEKENVKILVLSQSPVETRKIYRVDAVGRLNLFKLINRIKQAKVLISGGGSLLQDETSSKSLWYYLFVIKLAKMLGLKVMQFANGFGPVKRKFNQRLTKNIINECVDVITLREEASEAVMRKIGIENAIEVTSDPAMLLKGASDTHIKNLFEKMGVNEEKFISVSVREWKKNAPDFDLSVGEAIKAFCEKYDLKAVFVPMQYPHDVEISKRVARVIGDRAVMPEEKLSIDEAIGIISRAELNVAMRLHAMIYSVSASVRTVALRYDPKIDGFMDYVRLGNIVNVEKIEKDELFDHMEKAYGNEEMPDCEYLKKKARINTRRAIELL